MQTNTPKITGVPTNIITGFLGVGKTSAILHLLRNKPADERWAVLVNEFGEIGVDGSLFQGRHSASTGVFIRQVPGGCMCCAAGLPMQSALNQLLLQAQPHRLLIEPTGLGHPREVLQTLASEHYQGVLAIGKVVTLVDARKLFDSRYTEHETFNQQIAIADVVVGNKQDLYAADDKAKLAAYVKAQGTSDVKVFFTEQGALQLSWLEGLTLANAQLHPHHHHTEETTELLDEQPLPDSGYLQAVNQGEGFASIGWRFAPNKVFARIKLLAFFQNLQVERLKAVFITEQGVCGYNLTSDGLNETELDVCSESRIEIIATQIDENWKVQLLECVHFPLPSSA